MNRNLDLESQSSAKGIEHGSTKEARALLNSITDEDRQAYAAQELKAWVDLGRPGNSEFPKVELDFGQDGSRLQSVNVERAPIGGFIPNVESVYQRSFIENVQDDIDDAYGEVRCIFYDSKACANTSNIRLDVTHPMAR